MQHLYKLNKKDKNKILKLIHEMHVEDNKLTNQEIQRIVKLRN